MFHWVTGIPFDNGLHAGAYDDLTLWEQIDDGAQYTPSRKWLLMAPILLYVPATALQGLCHDQSNIVSVSSPRRITLITTLGCLLSTSQRSLSLPSFPSSLRYVSGHSPEWSTRPLTSVQLHRQRVRFLAEDASGMATPVTPSFSHTEQLKQIDPSNITEALFK